MAPTTRAANSRWHGDASLGHVQVLLAQPDDMHAKVLFVSAGVEFVSHNSMVPKNGVITCHASPSAPAPAVCYRWRG